MIQLLIPALTSLIDRLFPDQEKAAKAKAEMMTIMADAQAKEMEAKSNVIVAEANGESKAQRNWRPHLMYLFMTIMAFNYIVVPVLAMFGLPIQSLPIPPDMWMLLTIGVGGYIGGRSYEKSKLIDNKKFFDAVRSVYGSMSQGQVDALNKQLNK